MRLNSTFKSVTTEQLHSYVVRFNEIQRSTGEKFTIYAEGEPGLGKTSVVRSAWHDIAETLDRTPVETPTPQPDEFGLVVVHFGNIGEESASGLPWADKDTGRIFRAFESMWPREGEGILFLDEPFQASYAQRFVAQLVSDGRIGEYELPHGWQVVLAGNAAEHRAGAQRIFTHTQNRLIHLRVESSAKAATEHFIRPCTPEVGVFLRWFPEKLTQFDAAVAGPFATARVWDKTNSLLHNEFDPVKDFPLFQGLLGTDTASEFRTYVNAISSLPDIDAMMAKPNEYVEVMRSMPSTTAAAFASVMLKKYANTRNTHEISTTITLVSHHRAELVGAVCSLANEIDQRAGDGVSVYDTPGYAAFASKFTHLVS